MGEGEVQLEHASQHATVQNTYAENVTAALIFGTGNDDDDDDDDDAAALPLRPSPRKAAAAAAARLRRCDRASSVCITCVPPEESPTRLTAAAPCACSHSAAWITSSTAAGYANFPPGKTVR